MTKDPFTITCHSGFNEEGVWTIDVRLHFRGSPPPLGSALLGAGRIALLQVIAREAQRGRALGATKVKYRMEGQDGAGPISDIPDPDEVTH